MKDEEMREKGRKQVQRRRRSKRYAKETTVEINRERYVEQRGDKIKRANRKGQNTKRTGKDESTRDSGKYTK